MVCLGFFICIELFTGRTNNAPKTAGGGMSPDELRFNRQIEKNAEAQKRFEKEWDQRQRDERDRERWRRMSPDQQQREVEKFLRPRDK